MLTVTDVQTMRESDRRTILAGIDSRELMYRAGQALADCYAWRGRVAIVCGSGNNAGDGYVLAQILFSRDIDVTLFLLSDRFSEDGAFYYEKCKEMGIDICNDPAQFDFSDYREIADCIFGTGFRGDVGGVEADVIRLINRSGKTVISADINSGLCGDNGQSSLCVRSDLTASIGFYQYGHFLGQAKDVIGRLSNLDIGIELYGTAAYLTEATDFGSVLCQRKHHSHKGTYGYVSILGGCTEYSGAVKLANLSCAALRSGCGVAKLAVPSSLVASVSPFLLESTLFEMPDRDGKMLFCPEAIDRLLTGQAALAIGMGWGTSEEYERILRYILEHYAIPVVIDADGLNTLAKLDRSLLQKTACRVILTPHPKEMERLCGTPVGEILKDPVKIAEAYARDTGACVLLKGACTVVTDAKQTYLVHRGCPGMATAGSGDVLSGILVGLLGYAAPDALTVACGAFVAGVAAEMAQSQTNPISMLASDTVSKIADAVTYILSCTNEGVAEQNT